MNLGDTWGKWLFCRCIGWAGRGGSTKLSVTDADVNDPIEYVVKRGGDKERIPAPCTLPGGVVLQVAFSISWS